MAVEIHTYLDVQSLLMSRRSILLWISDKATCGKTTSLFFLVVRSIVRSTYLCREVATSAG